MASHPLIACTHCDAVHERVALQGAEQALCRRCGSALYRGSHMSPRQWQALVLAVMLVFLIANTFPIVSLNLAGRSVSPSFPGALLLIWQQGYRALSVMTGLVGFWLPLFQLLFQFWALDCIARRRMPRDFAWGLRTLRFLQHWSMTTVLFLGIVVAIVKFSGFGDLRLQAGLYAFLLLSFLLTGLSRLHDRRLWMWAQDSGLFQPEPKRSVDVWDPTSLSSYCACQTCGLVQELANSRCPRCGTHLHKRIPNSQARTLAYLITAIILYIPANVLPMMELHSLAMSGKHTILGGIIQLWELGSWDLALIVFIASVVVPITKILALSLLVLRRRWRGIQVQKQRNRLYDMVELIGQWSMLDVFVVVLMAALANFPGVSQIVPGPAALSFGLVVVFTMLAAQSYDPREGWVLACDKPGSCASSVLSV